MSARLLLRLALVLAALLLVWGAVAIAGRRSGDRGAAGGSRLFAIDTARVDSVRIAGARDTTLLARSDRGWRVNGHGAATAEVTALLGALADTAAQELVAEQRSSHDRLGVNPDSGRTVRVVGGGKTAEMVVGRAAAAFGSGYVRRADEAAVYQVRGRLPDLVARSADDWRDKTIVNVFADSIARVEVRRGREQYELRRHGAQWRFGTGGPADSSRAADLTRDLAGITAAGFAAPDQAVSLRFTRPDRRLTLKDAAGRILAALLIDSTESAFWVRHDSGGTVWRMESWEVDRITPAASSLRRARS